MRKKYFFYTFLLLQLSIISLLVNDIYKKKILGSASITLLDSHSVVSNKKSTLKHFYEPKPNSISKPEVIFSGLEHVSYHINKDGFNQIGDYEKEKQKGIYRIIAIGDSFTFGSKVNTVENYPSQLEAMLNTRLSCPHIQKFEVLNLGVGGYDIQYTLERLRLRGIQYNPDLIIWLLIADDFTRLDEFFYPHFLKYLSEAKTSGEYSGLIENGIYDTEWNRAKNEVITELGGYHAVFNLQKKYMNNIYHIYSGNLLFSLLPTPYDTNTDKTMYINFLKTFSQKRVNTYFYDTLPNIYASSDTFLPDYHPNKKGHFLLAESFMMYLLNQKILNCSIK